MLVVAKKFVFTQKIMQVKRKKNQQIQTQRCNNADESKQKVYFFLRMLVRMVLKFVGRYVEYQHISIIQTIHLHFYHAQTTH